MKIFKTRDVKTPNRGTEFSAGIDFFVPKINDKLKSDIFNNEYYSWGFDKEKRKNYIILLSNERILIPSGIKINIPKDTVLIAFNKSGVSSKKGLTILANVVDQDYYGELHLSLLNTSSVNVKIYEDEKIIQFLLLPIIYENIEEIKDGKKLFEVETERGESGFGSTGK